MIRFKCECGKQIQAADEGAGRWGKCPACGQRIQIPRPDEQTVSMPAPADAPSDRQPKVKEIATEERFEELKKELAETRSELSKLEECIRTKGVVDEKVSVIAENSSEKDCGQVLSLTDENGTPRACDGPKATGAVMLRFKCKCGKELQAGYGDAGKWNTCPRCWQRIWIPLVADQCRDSRVEGPQEEITVELGGGITMEMILVPAGEFMMGSEKWGAGRKFVPVHNVRLTRPFYIGKYEVTQEQWYVVMGTNPSQFFGPHNPVECVSWKACQSFVRKAGENVARGLSRLHLRLPTEAEWEYACRAGTTTEYSFGDSDSALGEYAWHGGNSGGATHPVGQKKPNAWGLYDMHGNVWEWCEDWYSAK